MIVRICAEEKCRTRLSNYNRTDRCWEHRRAPRRIEGELAGRVIQRDDDYVLRMLDPGTKIETWRPHMMSETFIAGLERRVLNDSDRRAYETGEWL